MTHREILNKIDGLIKERSILNHPFYIAWKEGNLNKEQLKLYAKIYYPHVANFPKYLRYIIENTDDRKIQMEAELNLKDELSHPAPHNELWIEFAKGLDMTEEEVINEPIHSSAKNIVETYTILAKKSPASGLAALYSYEAQQPEVSHEKIDGLINHYKVTDPSALAYFDVHSTADIEHRRGEREALMRCLKTGTTEEELIDSVNKALDAYHELLTGIMQEAEV
jgi:pyrroloquinoline-quinone synthase